MCLHCKMCRPDMPIRLHRQQWILLQDKHACHYAHPHCHVMRTFTCNAWQPHHVTASWPTQQRQQTVAVSCRVTDRAQLLIFVRQCAANPLPPLTTSPSCGRPAIWEMHGWLDCKLWRRNSKRCYCFPTHGLLLQLMGRQRSQSGSDIMLGFRAAYLS